MWEDTYFDYVVSTFFAVSCKIFRDIGKQKHTIVVRYLTTISLSIVDTDQKEENISKELIKIILNERQTGME